MRHSLSLVLLLSATVLAQQGSAGQAEALFDAARSGDRAERGHFDVVRLLVERGADVTITDSFYGSRPLDMALRGGRLDIALYLLEHKSPGAASVLNTAIRRRDAAAVRIALATRQIDAMALATANTIATQAGDAGIAAMVKAAAKATPAVAPVPITVATSLLRSYEGNYQNATTGAGVKVAFDGTRLTLTRRP